MGKRYINPHASQSRRNFFHFLLFILGGYDDPRPIQKVPADFSYPVSKQPVEPTSPTVSWINHSTYLIKYENTSFLTDPIWSKRCSPFPFMGPKREFEPPFPIEKLPKIDFVIISHNHYDHLDFKTIKKLYHYFPEIQWIVPIGVKEWFLKHIKGMHAHKVIELEWWDSYTIQDFKFTAVPCQHFSGRSLCDRDRTLWMGCVVEKAGGKKFFFAGDTGYNEVDFKEIGKRFAPMDLSLLPIGAYLPRDFMKVVHINPAEAVEIHEEVGSKFSIGGHTKTFKLSFESFEQAAYDLFLALKHKELSCEDFLLLKPGEPVNW